MGCRVRIELYASLGATGRGHGTDVAVLLGLCGHLPDVVDPDAVPGIIAGIRERGRLSLLDRFPIDFTEKRDLSFNRGVLPRHSNGLRFMACAQAGPALMTKESYSIGGGFEIGQASGRERGCQYVYISVRAVSFKKNTTVDAR